MMKPITIPYPNMYFILSKLLFSLEDRTFSLIQQAKSYNLFNSCSLFLTGTNYDFDIQLLWMTFYNI